MKATLLKPMAIMKKNTHQMDVFSNLFTPSVVNRFRLTWLGIFLIFALLGQLCLNPLFAQTRVKTLLVQTDLVPRDRGTYTVPDGGPYKIIITVRGGGGGNCPNPGGTTNGGRGAIVTGSFSLPSGTILDWVKGKQGQNGATERGYYTSGAGGGSSGVNVRGIGALVVAGGGGGASGSNRGGVDAGNYDNSGNGNGGNGGAGNTVQDIHDGGGGGGYNTNGFDNAAANGGKSYANGGAGGSCSGPWPGCVGSTIDGKVGGNGFTGGGASSSAATGGAGGGGGGYSGGNGGRYEYLFTTRIGFGGDGGSSFISTWGFDKSCTLPADNSNQDGFVQIQIESYVSNNGRIISDNMPVCSINAFNQLEALYDATGGANWTNRTNWFIDGDLRNWYGVTMTDDKCHVKAIALPNNNLTGSLPALNLPACQSMLLNNNNLSGTIPALNAPFLEILKLHTNNFSGALPSFSGLPRLSELNVVGNQLTALPNALPYYLTQLDVGLNKITGNMPNSWDCPYLRFLSVYGNQMSGQIPNLFLPSLETVYFANNSFSGNLPLIVNATGGFSPQNVYIQNNNYNFGHIINKSLIQGTGTIVYAPQKNIPIYYNNCALSVDVGIINNTQTFVWFKDNVEIARTNNGQFTPTSSGTYRCDAYNYYLTRGSANPNQNLILQTNDYVVAGLEPSIRITVSPSSTMYGNVSTTFTAIITNGGSTPQYQWQRNGNPVGTNSPTYITSGLANADVITCTLTSSTPCQPNPIVTSNAITMTVYPCSAVIYVKPTAVGRGDGLDWANATNDVQAAINGTLNICGATEIWVAAGTYKPLRDLLGNSNPTNARDKAFLLKNGVKLYGGFAGTEGSLSERNWRTNRTILSGDAHGNDAGFTNNSENLYHVVVSVSDDNTTVLDGFIVQGGNANGSGTVTVETKVISRANGGGLYNQTASPAISNCILTNNYGATGGGLFNEAVSGPMISKSVIHANTAVYGGGVFNAANSVPSFVNTILANNTATSLNFGVYNQAASPTFSSCTVLNSGIYNEQSGLTVTNSIVWGSSGISNPNGVLNVTYSTVTGGVSGAGNLNTDPIFADANDGDGADNQWLTADDGFRLGCGSPAFNTGTTTVLTTDILGATRTQLGATDRGAYESSGNLTNQAPSVNIAASPSTTVNFGGAVTFTATPTNVGTTPQYQWFLNNNPVGTNSLTYRHNNVLNGDVIRLTVSNINNFCPQTPSVGSNSLTMTVNCPSSARIFVKPTASGTGNGGSWANATDNLQGAINNTCGITEIWVAKGTYKPTTDGDGNPNPTDNRDKAFYLKNGVKLYGGFAGTEGVLSERNLTGNVPILSGDLNGDDNGFTNNGENAYHVVVSINDDNTTVFDGFIVTGGNASAAVNTTIEGVAMSRANGGGLVNHNSNQTVANCVFTGNSAGVGGGITNLGGSSAAMRNLVIHNNVATYGGGVFNQFSSPQLLNCTVNGNTASLYADGIYNQFNSSPTITNCIIWGNGSVNLYNEPAQNNNPTVTYSTVQGGYAGATNSGSDPVFINASNAKGVDNQWFTADDGLRLACGSPAFNSGTNTDAPIKDILGNTRPQFSTADVGAYESTVNLIPLTLNITGTSSACTSVTLTATATPPLGAGELYAWSSGTTPSVASNIFTTTGTYTVSVTATAGACSATASQSITVTPVFTPSVSIAVSPSANVAANTNLTFTATPINGGTTPQYQWFVNGTAVGTNSPTFSSNALANNSVITCTMTANNVCQTTNSANSNSIAVTICQTSSRLYVKPTASGTGDGSSWANATADLQQVINNICGITEIWVATGVYKPQYDAFGNATPTDLRNRTFNLRNNVRLYGGFTGTETNLSQRTPSVFSANPTILSGDFNDNDARTGNGGTLNITNNGENAYHVAVSSGTDAANLIDGFIIKGSNANGGGNYVLNGQTLYSNSGGGFYQAGCSVAVSNTVFQDNSAGFGAGLYCNAASPVVTNCIFDKNRVTSHGAAGLNLLAAAPIFNNCVFSNGRADGVGGAFYNLLGAAATFKNCTFFGNFAIPNGGVIYNDGSTSTITNGIIWGSAYSGNFGTFNGGTATVTYSTIEGGQSGVGNSASNPQFVNSNNVTGSDGQWFTADDGFQIQNISPARDAGTNTSAPTSDILGLGIFNTTKDMGAYEFQENIYAGSAACQSISLANVSGNQWFYFRHNNAIVAAINPNGTNLGTVTASISDPMGTLNFDNSKFLGRTINFTSSNYADGVTMPNAYALKLYYKDAELTELNQLTGGTARVSDFNMIWQQGTSGCTLSALNSIGVISKNTIVTGEYGQNNDGFYMQFPLNHFTVFAPSTSGSTVLPVEILKFSGYTEGSSNRLVWTTANEINSKGFQVERAPQPPQGAFATWDVLGFVPTKGKAAIYDFTDKALPSGARGAYYRLRQMDNDGKETLSKIISIAAAVETRHALSLHPNPATDVLTVEFTKGIGTTEKATTFEVINLFGQIILRGPLGQSVDVAALPNGTYIVRVGLEQVKFVKQ